MKVRLYPVEGAFIDGVPAEVTECTPEEAERLLAHTPPAFTTTPPDQAAAVDGPRPPKSTKEN